MRLTLKTAEEKIQIDDVAYVMLQPSQNVHDKYDIEMKKGTTVYKDGESIYTRVGTGTTTADVLLVSLCLYRADARGELPRDAKGKPDQSQLVPVQTLNEWPHIAVGSLVELAKKLGGITVEPSKNGEAKELDPKASPVTTTDG